MAGVFDPTIEGTLDASRWHARHLSHLNVDGIGEGARDERSEHECVLDEIAELRDELGLHAEGHTSD